MIDKCLPCQAAGSGKPPAPLKPSELPPSAWHTLKADFLGPIPGTHQPQYLLVIIDCYSRFPEVEIVSSTSASTVIPKSDRIFATHGIPIKTDNGPPFQSEEIDRYMKTWGIRHKRITLHSLRGLQGLNLSCVHLKNCCKPAQLKRRIGEHSYSTSYWIIVPLTPHCVTGVPPADLLFYRSIRTKLPELAATCDSVNRHHIARENDNRRKLRAKEYNDTRKHAAEREIRIGDIVLVKQEKKISWPLVLIQHRIMILSLEEQWLLQRTTFGVSQGTFPSSRNWMQHLQLIMTMVVILMMIKPQIQKTMENSL